MRTTFHLFLLISKEVATFIMVCDEAVKQCIEFFCLGVRDGTGEEGRFTFLFIYFNTSFSSCFSKCKDQIVDAQKIKWLAIDKYDPQCFFERNY